MNREGTREGGLAQVSGMQLGSRATDVTVE